MFKQLMIVAKEAQQDFKEREESGWSQSSLNSYKAGYNNAFFDIANRLVGSGISSKQREQLEVAFDGEVEDGKERVREVNKKKEHVHEYIEVDRVLLNGFQASNGCSSEFYVTRQCLKCGREETKWELGW